MEWFKRWIFGENNQKQATGQPKPGVTSKSKEQKHAGYLRDTLAFAKAQHHSLTQKQREYIAWQRHYGSLHVNELKKLTGTEFEDYLFTLFEQQGYQVKTTPSTGDYGADLILQKDNQRIAVQAKCYSGSVGISAVQEALSGMAYYRCDCAWVVTTGTYTPNAIELAKQSNVRLLGQSELGSLILQMQTQAKNHG